MDETTDYRGETTPSTSFAMSLDRSKPQGQVRDALTKLRSFIEKLGWTEQSLLTDTSREVCPVDHNHVVHSHTSARHRRRCQLRRMGYSKDDCSEMEKLKSTRHFYADSTNVVRVKFDQKLQDDVIRKDRIRQSRSLVHPPLPQLALTANREASGLIASDRAALYDYVVKLAEEERTMRNLTSSIFPPHELVSVAANQLAETDRHSLPRTFPANIPVRKPYSKGKRSQSSRVSYTEKIREIISSQMAMVSSAVSDVSPNPKEKSRRLEAFPRSLTLSSNHHLSLTQVSSPDTPKYNADRMKKRRLIPPIKSQQERHGRSGGKRT